MNPIVLTVLAGVIGGMEITIIIYIILAIVLFLILREVACWYWKINERIALIKEQNQLLNDLKKTLQALKTPTSNNLNLHPKVESSKADAPNQSIDHTAAPDSNEEVKAKLVDLPKEIIEGLSPAKFERIAYFMSVMGNDDVIVLHDNKIKLIDHARWQDILASGNQSKYQLIYSIKS